MMIYFSYTKIQSVIIKYLDDLSSGYDENYKVYRECAWSEEMKDFVYENYTFHDNKKEHGVLEKLKQACQTRFLYAAIWLTGNFSAAC